MAQQLKIAGRESVSRTTAPARKSGLLSETAYDSVKAGLLEGRYRAGSPISVEALVIELGMSRYPVMEALKRLAAEGLLDIIPQVGCRVVSPDSATIVDFFRLFARVEGLTAELAASRQDSLHMAQLRAISTGIGTLTDAALTPRDKANRYRLMNRAFHGEIHAMAQSDVITGLVKPMWDRADFFISSLMRQSLFADRLEQAHDEHEALIQAIAAGDALAARSLMESHILEFGLRLDDALRAG